MRFRGSVGETSGPSGRPAVARSGLASCWFRHRFRVRLPLDAKTHVEPHRWPEALMRDGTSDTVGALLYL